ncbi:hypothetical protein BGX28_010465 [Mortierella sp. GBA30]|nr:hypothetical protein BGX28_010465 [Mortierella sp. GBA30]
MVVDDDEDEDDGEIKQEIRSRRSVSVSSNQAQEGSTKKTNQSSQDHDQTEAHKCMDCGKVATKFLLSKHQQVQLMEAAAILLGMDESREGDKDPIVSMFSKQRGAMANSVGSSASATSSSSSPPTSTKSLSRSPPPHSQSQSQAPHSDRVSHGAHKTNSKMKSESITSNSDVQMLTALRSSHASTTHSSTNSVSETMTTSVRAAKEAGPTRTSSSSSYSSPANTKSASSSSSSTPPTLAPDDESLPEMDEDIATVTPPSGRGSISSAVNAVEIGDKDATVVMEMGLGVEVDRKSMSYQEEEQLTQHNA